MSKETEKKPKDRRKLAFRNEAIEALVKIEDENEVTFQKALEVAKLDCKKCLLHETHNPKHQNCRDNPFCINRLGLEKFEKLIFLEQETKEEAKKDQKRRDLNDQPAGLVNGGNFCYVNSFLQVWFNVPEFRQIVYDFRPSPHFVPPEAPRMNVQSTMLALQDIFYTLETTPFNETDKTGNLGKLLRLNSEQQDSQEFGLKFFNALERCLPDHPNGKETLNRLKDLFTGEICTRIVCKCGNRTERDETAISLTLNIEGHSTLLDALDAYFREEHLDDYKCSSCQKTGDVSKQSDYSKLPPVIVIQLNRYKYTQKGRQKLKTPMAYPRQIPAVLFQRTDQSNAPPAEWYDLFAVTIHEGNNAECGHYYDLIKSPYNQKWYRYNDETVEAIAKPPGTDKPTSSKNEKSRKKEKEKTPTDQKACYGLLYRRRDTVIPLPFPRFPPEELIIDSKNEIIELFEGLTKKKIETSEKRLYDLERRWNKLTQTQMKLECHVDKYTQPNEVAFIPTSLLIDIMTEEHEVGKGEKKKKKKKEQEKSTEEEEQLAAAIAASQAEMETTPTAEIPSTSTTETPMETEEEEEEEEKNEQNGKEQEEGEAGAGTEAVLDILATAMEESALPVTVPERKRTRQQNGARYVYSKSPRKTNGTSPQKQPVSSRVAALLTYHEIPICGHGKMSIDPILFGEVKAISRAPAIAMLREYDFRVKMVFDNGQKVFPSPQRDREVFVFTAEDICMECIREMRQEGLFNNRLEEDEKLVKRILKEEKLRCSVKSTLPRPDGHVYVAKCALGNFKKMAQVVRENRLARNHTRKGTLVFDSVTSFQQKADSTYPVLKRMKRGSRKSAAETPEKMPRLDEMLAELPNDAIVEEVEELAEPPPESPKEQCSEPLIEFNSELRCAHGGVNFSQFRHSVSPEEWAHLSRYFEECYEVRCSDEVCQTCRQLEVDAQNGSDNMRILVREMRKRINEVLKKLEQRSPEEAQSVEKFGICSVFVEKLKKLGSRQSTSPPAICQDCLLCVHQQPFRGFVNEDNQKEAHIVGLTEDEWNTFVTEIRNLEEAGEENIRWTEPRVIRIDNGQISGMCDECFEQHVKYTEEQKYMFENENIYVKLVNLTDEDDVAKANGKSRRGRAKNVYAIKMSSSSRLMELKVQLYDKTHQLPNDQILYRTVGGEQFDVTNNQKTLFDLRLSPNNNDNPLILIAQQFSPSATQSDETGDRAPERGFVDTALAH